MKDKLGIKICCENCLRDYCTWRHQLECKKGSKYFMPSKEAYEARIKELQEQQFTEDELHIIINMKSILLGQGHSLYDSLLTPLSKKLKRMINER